LNLTEPHVGQSNEFTHYGQGQARFENMGTQADYACGFSTGSWYKEGVGMESGAIRGQKPGEKTGEDTGERSEGVTDDF
jgi:hypothetical protein